MEAQVNEFFNRLKGGPAFLFLGQDYLAIESGVDSFLSEVLRKYGGTSTEKPDYHQILDSSAASSVEAALAWMDERCRRLSVPEWLKIVASYPWSGVYASAIDSVWPTCFRTQWREIQPLFEEKYRPSDPRNRLLLHCTFLFGCVNRAEEEERPPLTRFEWRKRRQVAVALARRLPEAVTPMGLLAIEGYAGDTDWLSPDDLLPILDELNPGQAHIFSATQGLLEHPDVEELTHKGKLVLHQERLAETLVRGEELGLLRLGRPPEDEEFGRRIRVEDKILAVPRDLWNEVSRSAIILDDAVLIEPPPLSEDARYREFRNFLSTSDGRPQWSAYAREFAFGRHFEKTLRHVVDRMLAAKTLQDEPVILNGQTGTGKTVALGALAYEVRKEAKYPVLFIERKIQRPLPADVDRFCQWAEDSGASACLVIWDGLLGPEEYSDFLRYLTSRGRKVVLVGSSYRIQARHQRESRFVLAPPELSSTEVDEFATFLKTFHPSLDEVLSARRAQLDHTFLVALYRLLPSTRASIRTGVAKEVGHAEVLMVRRAAEIPTKVEAETALARALLEAGIITREELLSTQTRDVGAETVTEVEVLTGLVMVPGRFGLRVPLELVIRALGKQGFSWLMEMLEAVDIFRTFEDPVGNIEIGPRNALEARLIVQARMGGAQTEVSFAKRLLLEVQDGLGGLPETREIGFAVDLIRSMGAQAPDRGYFAPYFRDLSETLRQLRVERGVENPRVMLQEANLLREWAIDQARAGVYDQAIEVAFQEMEAVLRRALDVLGDDRRSRTLRGHLLVELASAFGARARCVLRDPLRGQEAIQLFDQAQKATVEARAKNPFSFYPVDVLAWATKAVLESDVLDDRARAEAIANVLHGFQTAELAEFEPVQQERLNMRRLEFAEFLGMEDMAEEAFAALSAQGSGAGYYLRALRMSGLPDSSRKLTSDNIERLRKALSYLEENRTRFSGDGRCLELLLDLWWMVHTRGRLFERERATLPLADEEWRHCIGMITDLEATGQSYRSLLLGFLRGLALFHVGSVEQALEVFREVERESDQIRGRRRIVRSYLASTSAGQPNKFHGTVAWVAADGGRGGVYVEEVRRNILFIPRDFGRLDIGRGDTLGEFHVAFNFLGPIADPPGHYRP